MSAQSTPRPRTLIAAASLVAVLNLMGSCDRHPRPGQSQPRADSAAPAPGPQAEEIGPHFAGQDDLGNLVHISSPPQRIVSLTPSITETLFALGLDSLVAGVTDYCDFPEAAKSKPRIGGMLTPNIERIVELRPDLVLMSGAGNVREDRQKLVDLGLSVFVSYPRTVEEVLKSIADIGRLAGRRAQADSLLARLRARRETLTRTAAARPTRRVLVLLSLNPIVAPGRETFLDELIRLANGTNVAGFAKGYPVVSREEIVRAQPEVIVATDDLVKSAEDILLAYPEWRSLPAGAEGRVVLVDPDILTRPGPRIIDGLEVLFYALHPRR